MPGNLKDRMAAFQGAANNNGNNDGTPKFKKFGSGANAANKVGSRSSGTFKSPFQKDSSADTDSTPSDSSGKFKSPFKDSNNGATSSSSSSSTPSYAKKSTPSKEDSASTPSFVKNKTPSTPSTASTEATPSPSKPSWKKPMSATVAPSSSTSSVPSWKKKTAPSSDTPTSPSFSKPSMSSAPSWKKKASSSSSSSAAQPTSPEPSWKTKRLSSTKISANEESSKEEKTSEEKPSDDQSTSSSKDKTSSTAPSSSTTSSAGPSWKKKTFTSSSDTPKSPTFSKPSMSSAPSWKKKASSSSSGAQPTSPEPSWKNKRLSSSKITPSEEPTKEEKSAEEPSKKEQSSGEKEETTDGPSTETPHSEEKSSEAPPAKEVTIVEPKSSSPSRPSWKKKTFSSPSSSDTPKSPGYSKPSLNSTPSWKKKAASSGTPSSTSSGPSWKNKRLSSSKILATEEPTEKSTEEKPSDDQSTSSSATPSSSRDSTPSAAPPSSTATSSAPSWKKKTFSSSSDTPKSPSFSKPSLNSAPSWKKKAASSETPSLTSSGPSWKTKRLSSSKSTPAEEPKEEEKPAETPPSEDKSTEAPPTDEPPVEQSPEEEEKEKEEKQPSEAFPSEKPPSDDSPDEKPPSSTPSKPSWKTKLSTPTSSSKTPSWKTKSSTPSSSSTPSWKTKSAAATPSSSTTSTTPSWKTKSSVVTPSSTSSSSTPSWKTKSSAEASSSSTPSWKTKSSSVTPSSSTPSWKSPTPSSSTPSNKFGNRSGGFSSARSKSTPRPRGEYTTPLKTAPTTPSYSNSRKNSRSISPMRPRTPSRVVTQQSFTPENQTGEDFTKKKLGGGLLDKKGAATSPVEGAVSKLSNSSSKAKVQELYDRIQAAGGFPQVRRLSVRDNDLVSNMTKVIANDPSVTEIIIHDDPRFAHAGASLVSEFAEGLRANLHVTALSIKGVELGNDFLSALATSIESNFTLQTIDLSNNSFTSDALAEFCLAMAANDTIESVDLRKQHSPIFTTQEEDVLEALQQNTRVEKFHVEFLTKKCEQKLADFMSKKKVSKTSSKSYDDRLIEFLENEAERAEELLEQRKAEEQIMIIKDDDWGYLYELAEHFDRFKLEDDEEIETGDGSAPATPKRSPPGRKPPGRSKSTPLSKSGQIGSKAPLTADGAFLTEEFITSFLVANDEKKSLTFDFRNHFRVFKRFPTTDDARPFIVKKFVEVLLAHPKQRDFTGINMANSCCGNDFLIELSDKCLQNNALLPKLHSFNAETNYITESGVVALSKCIGNANVWKYLQEVRLENQRHLLSSKGELSLAKALCVNRSVVRLSLRIRNLLERQQISKYIQRNVDFLRQARRRHAIAEGTLQERKRNEMEQYFDKIAANDPSITEVELVGNNRFMALNREETLKAGLAFKGNTHIKTVKMCTLKLDCAFAQEMAKSIANNNTIEILSLDSNAIASDGMKALVEALASNSSIVEMQLRHQSKVCATSDEELLPQLLGDNQTIVKLGIDFRSQRARNEIERKLAKNRDIARKARNAAKK